MARDTPGPLLLVGGAEFLPGNEPHDRVFADAARRGPAYVVATAAIRQDPDRAVRTAQRWFAGLDLAVEELRVRGRRDANDPGVVAAAGEAAGIYLCGGDPGLLVEILRDADAWTAMVEAWRSGAALAGSSAGAMAFGAWSLIRAGRSHDRRRFAPALGLLPGTAIVPHLDEFGERWLPGLRPPTTEAVLLGIDTRTAAVWRPRLGWRAMGRGRVAVIADGARRERTAGGRPTGLPRPGVSRRK